MYELVYPLGPDRCRSDRCAPCTYWHTKKLALNGGRDKLSPSELEFVGVGNLRSRAKNSGGWHQPNETSIVDHLSAQDQAMLAALMDTGDVGQERMRFLGG